MNCRKAAREVALGRVPAEKYIDLFAPGANTPVRRLVVGVSKDKKDGPQSGSSFLPLCLGGTKSHLDYLYISGFSMVSTFRN